MTALARGVLFLSAFLPVFPLIAFRVWDANQLLAWAVLAIAGVIAILTVAVIQLLGRGATRRVISLIDGRDSSIVIVYAVMLAFLVIVAVRSRLVYLNPVLAAFGLHVYDVDVESPPGGVTESLLVMVADADLRENAELDVAGSTGPIQRAVVVTVA
jgi:hypothetical protein